MQHRILITSGLILAATMLVGGLNIDWAEPDVSHSVQPPKTARIASVALPEKLPQYLTKTTPVKDLPPLPPELEGLEPDTKLITDADGNLIPSKDLRVLLDFYLANLDQEPLTTVLARIRKALDQQLDQPALGQALSLLERYVGYRMALEDLQASTSDGITQAGFDLEALQQRQVQMEQLQHEHFNRREKTAFFQEDAKLDNYTLARLAIEQNPALTAAQKQQQLEQLSQKLPEAVRTARKRAVIHGEVYEKAAALKANQASDAEVYQLRARELGEVAALELAKLDQQQQAWQQRLTDYQQQKSRILRAGLSGDDQAEAVTQLRNRLFSGTERLRVRALEGEW